MFISTGSSMQSSSSPKSSSSSSASASNSSSYSPSSSPACPSKTNPVVENGVPQSAFSVTQSDNLLDNPSAEEFQTAQSLLEPNKNSSGSTSASVAIKRYSIDMLISVRDMMPELTELSVAFTDNLDELWSLVQHTIYPQGALSSAASTRIKDHYHYDPHNPHETAKNHNYHRQQQFANNHLLDHKFKHYHHNGVANNANLLQFPQFSQQYYPRYLTSRGIPAAISAANQFNIHSAPPAFFNYAAVTEAIPGLTSLGSLPYQYYSQANLEQQKSSAKVNVGESTDGNVVETQFKENQAPSTSVEPVVSKKEEHQSKIQEKESIITKNTDTKDPEFSCASSSSSSNSSTTTTTTNTNKNSSGGSKEINNPGSQKSATAGPEAPNLKEAVNHNGHRITEAASNTFSPDFGHEKLSSKQRRYNGTYSFADYSDPMAPAAATLADGPIYQQEYNSDYILYVPETNQYYYVINNPSQQGISQYQYYLPQYDEESYYEKEREHIFAQNYYNQFLADGA